MQKKQETVKIPKGCKKQPRTRKVTKTRPVRKLTSKEEKARKAKAAATVGQVAAAQRAGGVVKLTIPKPNFAHGVFPVESATIMMQNRFGEKARQQMQEDQEMGDVEKKKRRRKHEPKDFEECYRQAMHRSPEGWYGIPAPAFRTAMITACKTVGFIMELAKLTVFVEEDGYGEDGTPLVRITEGEPEMSIMPVRIQGNKTDLRARPLFRTWKANVTLRWDADQLTLVDIANLLSRVGLQVGLGEGRPASKNSAGLGYGLFKLAM